MLTGMAMAITEARTAGMPVATRDRILWLLRRHGALSAPQLGGELALAPEGVRRHLAGLRTDGLVECEPLPAATGGRPAVRYRLTADGRDRFPHDYDRVAAEALDFLAREGGLAAFLAARADAEAARLGPTVAAAAPARRPAALAAALSRDGFMASVEPGPDGLAICQHHCTIGRLATQHPEVCEAEARLFARLLDRPVVRTRTIANGDARCVAVVAHESFPTDPRDT